MLDCTEPSAAVLLTEKNCIRVKKKKNQKKTAHAEEKYQTLFIILTFSLMSPKPSCFANPGMHRGKYCGWCLLRRSSRGTGGKMKKMQTSSIWDFFIQAK